MEWTIKDDGVSITASGAQRLGNGEDSGCAFRRRIPHHGSDRCGRASPSPPEPDENPHQRLEMTSNRTRAERLATATAIAFLAAPASADYHDARAIGYWVTAEEFGGSMATMYVVDVYLRSDDAWEGASGSGDTLLNVYDWNTVGGTPSNFFQSFTGTGWLPTNPGSFFDNEALRRIDSFVTAGGFALDGLAPASSLKAGAATGLDPMFGGTTCEPGEPCPGDLNGDSEVRGGDLGLLLAAWGLCP